MAEVEASVDKIERQLPAVSMPGQHQVDARVAGSAQYRETIRGRGGSLVGKVSDWEKVNPDKPLGRGGEAALHANLVQSTFPSTFSQAYPFVRS